MSCQIHHHLVFLLGIIIPLASIFSIVDGAFVIINHSGRDLEVECGHLHWTISVGERAVVAEAIDGGLEMLDPSGILKSETKLHQPSNGGLEILDPLEIFKPERKRYQPSKMCRIEAGNCFLSWDLAKLNHHSIREGNSYGDYEWEVEKSGVAMLQASNLRGVRSSLDCRAEYKVLWQPTSELFSGATECMCAPPSSPLTQAFYSVLLYFRE